MINVDEVKHLAKLSLLYLPASVLKKLQKDLQEVLAYVGMLQKDRTQNEPVSHITGLTNITRLDQERQGYFSLPDLVQAFPIRKGNWLKVAKIIDKDAL